MTKTKSRKHETRTEHDKVGYYLLGIAAYAVAAYADKKKIGYNLGRRALD